MYRGDGTHICKDKFVIVSIIMGTKSVATGSYHSMVLTKEGDVWTSGWNKYGQIGDGCVTSARGKFVMGAYKGREP